MPTTGANIVGPSSSFDQTDWLKTNPGFLNGKKNLYLSWSSKSDVSDTNNSVWAVGQVGTSAAMFFRHNTGNSAAPAAWLIGYTFSDRSVQYKSPANSGADNRLQRIAFQIKSGAAPQMWIDGVLQTPNDIVQDPTGSGYPTGGLVTVPADELLVGRAVHGLWDGLIDELRVIEDIKDTNYALTEFRNLNNIDDMVVFGDVESPSSALSPRGELIVAETTPGTKVRIKVDTLIVNPNPSSVVLSAVSTPTVGTAVKVDDANVDFTPTAATGTSRFTVTFTSGGKSVVVPVVVNISGTVSVRPPDITEISLLADRVAWPSYTEPPGFEGYQPKEGPDGATWATATNVGAKTTNKYVMKSGLLVPSKKVLVKPFANGLEALNAAEISLVAPPPPPPGDYWSSPNYGSKSRQDVGNHQELMNAIAGINTTTQYINMTYVDNTATTISRGGGSTHPLIITAQAPNGLNNFSGRPGFGNVKVTMDASYVWLDRLSFARSGTMDAAISIKGSWKFVTRCQIKGGQGIEMGNDVNANEFWIGFNRFGGMTIDNNSGSQGQIHIEAMNSSARPKNGRIYYNNFSSDGEAKTGNCYAMITGPGLANGADDTEYSGVNIEGTWFHYNFVDCPNRWGIYMKHGVDCMYNHINRCEWHAISLRGHCIRGVTLKYNRLVGGKHVEVQGWHHNIIGNYIRTSDGVMLSNEYQLGGDGKISRAARYSLLAGNDIGAVTIGACRDGASKRMIAPQKNCALDGNTVGQYQKWISDSNLQPMSPDANGRFPEAGTHMGMKLYETSSILVRKTTTEVLEPIPTLNATICGPGSDRGKVWGT